MENMKIDGFLTFKFGKYKKYWGATENGEGEVYILKMKNMKI